MKRKIPTVHDLAAQQKISVRRVMDFVSNTNPLGCSSRAGGAIRKGIKTIDRPAADGDGHLVRALARMYDVPEENILTACSFDALFTAIMRSVAGAPLCCRPYPAYYRIIMEGPVNFQFLDLEQKGRFHLDRELWEQKVKGCGAALISYPSFISGQSLTRDDIREMIALAEDTGMILIIDETLRQYTPADSVAGDIAGHPHCLIVSSLTEYYALQGLPVAYCIGEKASVAAIRRSCPITPPSALADAAAAASVRDKAYSRKTRTYLSGEQAFIEERLNKIPGISFYMTQCGSFVIKFLHPPSKGFDRFSRYNILVDIISGCLLLPVKNHKWNARYLKTLKNIMGERTDETP